MRLSRAMIPRASAVLLVLIPVVSLGIVDWLADRNFPGSDEVVPMAEAAPLYLMAIWCAFGRTNMWLRGVILAAACALWALWLHFVFPHENSVVFLPFTIGTFGIFCLPMCVIRMLGVSVRLAPDTPSDSADLSELDLRARRPRFSLGTIFQVISLGALLMAADHYFGFSREIDAEEVVIGIAISTLVAMTTWLSLGRQRLWLRFVAWLTLSAMIFLPFSEAWDEYIVFSLGILAILGIELLGFRRLGYRLVWGDTSTTSVANDPIPWSTLWYSVGVIVAVALYTWFLGRTVAWSQPRLFWYTDGMASFGAYMMSTLQTPIYLLAIWCALGNASFVIRLATTVAGCCAGMLYLAVADPYAPLDVGAEQVPRLLLVMIIPLFALRPFGLAIRRQLETMDSDVQQQHEPQFSLRNALAVVTAAALLMALNRYSTLFDGILDVDLLRGLVLANLLLASIVYACLGAPRWWLRTIPWLLCLIGSTCILSEFPLRNFVWGASMSVAVGGVLLAFRLRGFRFSRQKTASAPMPALSALNLLTTPTDSFTLATSK